MKNIFLFIVFLLNSAICYSQFCYNDIFIGDEIQYGWETVRKSSFEWDEQAIKQEHNAWWK
ncbi:MAG: hypothetical protein LBT29_02560 [Flavobacteriaceae bacterium]|nr:hypothetical protein [Flavobacteriaceae bacterium]